MQNVMQDSQVVVCVVRQSLSAKEGEIMMLSQEGVVAVANSFLFVLGQRLFKSFQDP